MNRNDKPLSKIHNQSSGISTLKLLSELGSNDSDLCSILNKAVKILSFIGSQKGNTKALIRLQPLEYRSSQFTKNDFTLTNKLNISDDGKLEIYLTPEALLSEADKDIFDISCNMLTEFSKRSLTENRVINSTNKSNRFIADVSHEIRTPLNTIIGMTYLCQRINPDEKLQTYLNHISTASKLLLKLVNDILDLSKLKEGKFQLENRSFSISKILDSLSVVLEPQIREKKLEFITLVSDKIPLELIGDPLRIQQVLINLCSNAIKYTNTGKIKIEVKPAYIMKKRILLEFKVSDTGCGIPKDELENLFSPFKQVLSKQHAREDGAGLGLTICHQLVTLMGGEIKVKSTLNKGSEFCFTTELECRNFQSQKQLFPQCDIKNLKILVVDPNKPALVKTASTLREFNWNVYCCTSAKDAISEINFHDSIKEPFDLVVTEYEMNSITGPMLVQSIQNSQTIKTLPKFVFTSIGHHVELPESADNLGVKGIAIKPITSPVLLDAIMLSYDKFVHCGKCNIPTKQQFKSKIKDLKNTKILLVEDDEINQEICTELLEQFGFQVTIASNGIQALESVSQFHFDLVLLDIQLPDLDGYKVAETIRLEDKLKDLPIIALSSNTRPDDIKQCKLSGMNAHIAKPVIPVTLLSTISKWIQTEHIPTPSFDDSRSSSELQKIQGLDISSGLKNVGGNEDFYKRILLKFAHQYKDNILKTGTALLRKEYEKAHLLTHNLKSITGNIGALDIHLKISTLNQIIRNRNQPDKSKLEETHRALAELCSSIEDNLKPEHKSGSPWLKQCSDTKKELFTKEIETLQKLVAQNDVSAKTKYSKIQQEYRFEEFREFFSNLETFLDKYEFEKADNYIKEYIS